MPKPKKPQKTLQEKRYEAGWLTIEIGCLTGGAVAGFLTHLHTTMKWPLFTFTIIGAVATWVMFVRFILSDRALRGKRGR